MLKGYSYDEDGYEALGILWQTELWQLVHHIYLGRFHDREKRGPVRLMGYPSLIEGNIKLFVELLGVRTQWLNVTRRDTASHNSSSLRKPVCLVPLSKRTQFHCAVLVTIQLPM